MKSEKQYLKKPVSVVPGTDKSEDWTADHSIQAANTHVGIDGLDGYALHELVKAIYAGAPDKSSGRRAQHICIEYNGIGFIPPNELTNAKTA